jgi:hypothetical protein
MQTHIYIYVAIAIVVLIVALSIYHGSHTTSWYQMGGAEPTQVPAINTTGQGAPSIIAQTQPTPRLMVDATYRTLPAASPTLIMERPIKSETLSALAGGILSGNVKCSVISSDPNGNYLNILCTSGYIK